jgi:VWFA-related protein
LAALVCWMATAQSQQSNQQDVPDAPSASRPAQPFPSTPAPERPQPAPPEENPPANAAPPSSESPAEPRTQPNEAAPAPPMPPVKTVPEGGGANPEAANAHDQIYTLKANVNFVVVPVSVKDENGHMVDGLLPTDFTVLEDGIKQKLTYFTSDPMPLSAAIVLDLGMPDVALQKVNQTFTALEGSFSPFDQVAIYTYSSAVSQVTGFSAVNQKITEALGSLKTQHGHNNGPAVTSGPLGPQGPIVNGVPMQTGNVPIVYTPPKEASVLNDAVLQAARDLAKQDRARRKIIFLISNGREYGSRASYSDVLKVLLQNEIQVYAVGVENSAIPGYNKLERIHLPKFGTGDILPKYANATGGEVMSEFNQDAIGRAYAQAIGTARNQYTLGYTTRTSYSSKQREIEVRVDRPGCKTSNLRPCVDVFAKAGYIPLPPSR